MTVPLADSSPLPFSQVMTVEQAQRQRAPLTVTMTPDECAALARHFGWLGVDALSATLHFSGTGTQVAIDGHVRAEVTQACVVTGQPLREHIDDAFAVQLVPVADLESATEDEERELDADALDTIGYRDGAFDIGIIIAETLALAVTPWPRAQDADAWLADNGVGDGRDAGPFAALGALRDAMKRD